MSSGKNNKEDKIKKEQKLQELQILEQSLQQIFFQKQSFQIELLETESALKEIKNSGDEIYKVIGQLMIKSNKEKIEEELEKKKNLTQERINEIDKQEEILTKRLNSLRKDII